MDKSTIEIITSLYGSPWSGFVPTGHHMIHKSQKRLLRAALKLHAAGVVSITYRDGMEEGIVDIWGSSNINHGQHDATLLCR